MNKQIYTHQLLQFGLNEIEVQIYLYLLENGSKTPLDISRETNINRTKIYRYLERLKAKRLIEESNVGRGITLSAANPTNLESLIFEKENELKLQKDMYPSLLKDLTTLPSISRNGFEIKHYHGPDGMKQMLWNHLAGNKEILVFGYETRNEITGKAFAENIRHEQISRRITEYEIENATDQGDYWYTSEPNWEKYYRSRYIPPQILAIKQYQVIFNDTISIMNWTKGNEVGIEIKNQALAQMYKQFFWKFWEISEGYIEEGKRLEAKRLKEANSNKKNTIQNQQG